MKVTKALRIANSTLEYYLDILEQECYDQPYQEEPTLKDIELKESYDAFHKIQQLIGVLED